MSAPKRLLEDPATSEALRADLQVAAQHQVGYDLASGLARFEANLPNIAVGSSAGGAQALLVKLGIVGAVGGALVLALVLQSRPPTPSAMPAVTVSHAPPPVAGEAPIKRPAAEPAAAEVVAPPSAESNQPALPAPARPAAKAASRATAAEPAVSPSELLAEEVQQLREIRQIVASNPAEALRLANAGHSRFRHGVLYQEREALALSALAALGRRQELEQRGTRYLKAFPGGSFSARVRQLLAR